MATVKNISCGNCSRVAFNPSIDAELFFCGVITDAGAHTASRGTLFLGTSFDQLNKLPNRCPRKKKQTLDAEIAEEI